MANPSSAPNTSPSPFTTTLSGAPLDPRLFPDGLKTSGKKEPLPHALAPEEGYEAFPREITGETVWRAEDYADRPERWTRRLTPDEVEELGGAADAFIASGVPRTGMSKDLFPLPTLGALFASLRPVLIDGRGFVLLKGLPVTLWSKEKCAVAYLGIGAHFGYVVSQNGRGHVLGHVKNLSEAPSVRADGAPIPIRVYRTNKRQFFHTDSADLVGLLCMARSMTGGESDIVSQHHLFNVLQREDPEVVRTLTSPDWYYDRKGELSVGDEPYFRTAVFLREDEGKRRVFSRYDPMNVRTLARFNSGADARIPPPSLAQEHAMDVLEATAKRLALHMVLEPGDIQLLANNQVYHARTAYEDWPAGSVDEQGRKREQRQLMRLWLATPEGEGGWALPYADKGHSKRGGVQVDDTPPVCPLDAE